MTAGLVDSAVVVIPTTAGVVGTQIKDDSFECSAGAGVILGTIDAGAAQIFFEYR